MTSLPVSTFVEAKQAASKLCSLGAQALLVKGREWQDEPDGTPRRPEDDQNHGCAFYE